MTTTDHPFHMQGVRSAEFRRWVDRSISEKRTVTLTADPALSGDLIRLTDDAMHVSPEFHGKARDRLINEGAFLEGF